MRRTRAIGCWVVLAGVAWFQGAAAAQQATVQTPLHTLGDGFYERIGLQWGLNFPGGFARFGGPSVGMPPSGRFDPNAGLNFGFGFRGGDINGFFSGAFAQGFQRSFVTQAPVLTLTSGVPGYVGDASISPFVVGSIPVVGGANLSHQEPQAANLRHREPTAAPAKVPEDSSIERLAAAQASSAGQAAMSVAEARRLHAAELEAAEQEAQRYWQKGLAAEKEGSLASARIYYRLAAKRATGEFQKRILSRLGAIKTPSAERN